MLAVRVLRILKIVLTVNKICSDRKYWKKLAAKQQ
jgi:hypothetical protein